MSQVKCTVCGQSNDLPNVLGNIANEAILLEANRRGAVAGLQTALRILDSIPEKPVVAGIPVFNRDAVKDLLNSLIRNRDSVVSEVIREA